MNFNHLYTIHSSDQMGLDSSSHLHSKQNIISNSINKLQHYYNQLHENQH